MKYLIPTLLLLFTTYAQSNPPSSLSELTPLEWQNRIIIVNETPNPKQIIDELKQSVYEIDDRVIIWFVINNQTIISNYKGELSEHLLTNLQKRYQLTKNEVVLIGKDGGIKSSRNTLDLKAIFSEIDAMPMRIQEMRY
ncbi:MAG: DUF4174 domain-containing protein [Thiotrichales bacterium]|nr:DUF4174 domain-containing protein [Thiotrichales bacterium]